ncbi:MAG: CoA transferase [Thermaerobacter sp.]|nr:formyl-CoA transferase [Bacillota bacterium]
MAPEARNSQAHAGPLEGYRVLELGNLVAAPFAGRLFAEFGAEVIKVERPGTGDELRQWRRFGSGDSLWWQLSSRNKKSITLDLRRPEGQELALELVRRSDVVLENFRPGTLEKWNLGPDAMRAVNPDVILVRISGYGQTGPYRDRPGFGGVAEAMGGIRYLTGYPDRPPTRVGISLGDSLAGMFGVIGALMALLRREKARSRDGGGGGQDRSPARGLGDGLPGTGQVVDVALYEAVFALMEGLVPEYDGYGIVRERTGNRIPGVAPSSTYPCSDGHWIVIGGNGDRVFPRLMRAIGREDLAQDPRFQDNPGRAAHQDFLDDVIAGWTSQRPLEEALRVMVEAGVPAGPIYSAAQIVEDPHFQARGMLETHRARLGDGVEREVRFPGVVPKLDRTPGGVRWLGPELGAHNDEIYCGLLGLDPERLARLKEQGVI